MWLSEKENITIRHALNGLESKFGKYKVDGYCEATNTVYEFNGCKSKAYILFSIHYLFVGLWHGCPNCYRNGNMIASGSYLTMHEKFQNTLDKEEKLKKMNVHMITMWECDLKLMLKTDSDMKKYFENCKIVERLNPRDAFFGGRTGPTTLYKKIEEGERIDYVDICR